MVQQKLSEQEKQRLHAQHWRWIKMIIMAAFIGAAIGVLTIWLILHFDMNGLGTLIARSSRRLAVTALLTAGFASTFGMVAMGVAIMVKSATPRRDD